jgi:hypothetical protein
MGKSVRVLSSVTCHCASADGGKKGVSRGWGEKA